MNKIGFIQKNWLGVPKIVYGDKVVRDGIGCARYEINDCVINRRLRIDGIITTDLMGVKRLLGKLETVAREEGCGVISYIDDKPTEAEIAIFEEAGFVKKYWDSPNNIALKKEIN